MKDVNFYATAVQLIAVLVTAAYAIMKTRAAVDHVLKKLDRYDEVLAKYEHRLTVVETTCRLTHKREPAPSEGD